MDVVQYTLEPLSPWISPLRSDTLHGLLACQIAEWEGTAACKAVLQGFLENKPLYTCSSAFPQGFLPMPVLPPMPRALFKKLYTQGARLITALQLYKKFKQCTFMPYALWQQHRDALSTRNLFSAYCDNAAAWAVAQTTQSTQAHVSINRNNQTSLDGGLFFQEVHYEQNPLQIYVQSADQERIKLYLTRLGELGFGADSTLGKGRFAVVASRNVSNDFNHLGKQFLSLSVLSAQNLNELKGTYRTFTKKGRTWVGKSAISPFKKPFIALEEGAVLHNISQNGVLQNIHVDPSIIQLCHALALPCTLASQEA